MAAGPYQLINVPNIPGDGTAPVAVISMGAGGNMSVFNLCDDVTSSGDVIAPARVLATTPAGTEAGLVVRNANDGTSGTGLVAPGGGSGFLGFISLLAQFKFGAAFELLVSSGGSLTVAVAAGHSSNTTIKGSAGRLCRVLVTTLGTNAMTFTDGASGTIIGIVPASAPIGVYIFDMPAATSIIAVGNAANPAVTVSIL